MQISMDFNAFFTSMVTLKREPYFWANGAILVTFPAKQPSTLPPWVSKSLAHKKEWTEACIREHLRRNKLETCSINSFPRYVCMVQNNHRQWLKGFISMFVLGGGGLEIRLLQCTSNCPPKMTGWKLDKKRVQTMTGNVFLPAKYSSLYPEWLPEKLVNLKESWS